MIDKMHLSNLAPVKFHQSHLKAISNMQTFVYPVEYQESVSDLEVVFSRRDCFGYCILSEETQDVIGYCIGFHIDPFDVLPVIQDPHAGIGRPSRSKKECPVFIYDCVVHPEYQGLSLGSRLVRSFLSQARKAGFSRIWAVAVDAQARSFWEKNGFVSSKDDSSNKNSKIYNDKSLWWKKIESEKRLPEIYSATGNNLNFNN